ncbi:MAG: carboxypeptidase regulatory-like domain-containing protein [Blastocatellia bacterium]|nr:carboxypeptidase regulatory-like domain-containing protein [Blastocatellia bacterium]
MNKLSRFIGAGVTTLLLLGVAFAQDFRGTITGRVTDSSKASIPNATVTVKNAATNEVFTVTTDNEGNYKVPFLRPGDYNITVEASGFKKAARENFVVAISQIAAVDFALEAGQITDTVTIEASGQVALESASADRGGVIDQQKVSELPLNARNPFMLGVLVAGVNFNGASIWQRPFDNGAIAEWTINGSQSRGNEFLLDGAPNNGQAGGNNIAYVPPVDSVQEFKIMTNTYDAQYGKTTGGIINVNLKSGTNAFHGNIYEFMRRESFDAWDFRLKARGRRADGSPVAPKPKHWLDQYGFQVDGPVSVPWLYSGKDKTFFMFNYEGYREGIPQPLTLSTIQPEFLDGDFSKLTDAAGRRIVIYDPLTGNAGNNYTRTPFPDNKIPAARINPIAKKILSYMPKPNTVDPAQGYSRGNLFLSPNIATDGFWNWVAKVDQQFNEKHRMYMRFAKNDRRENRNENGVINAVGECCQLPFKRLNDAFVADHLATFTPSFIFNFRVSFNRFEEKGVADENMGFDRTTLGFSSALVNSIPGSVMFGRYEPGDGYLPIGRNPGNNITNTIATHPNFTWIRGAQTWRAGVDIRFTQYNQKNEGNPFLLQGGRGFTQQRWDQADAQSGNGIATFLLGYVGGRAENNVFPTNLGKYFAPWYQNDWKIRNNLTINLGVRWDINQAPNERYNRLNRGFDATVTNPIDSLISRTTFPTLPKLLGGLNFAGVNGVDTIASDTDWNNFQPRIGFAYQWNSKLVIRGGWGLYYVNPNNDYLQTNGFSITTDIVNSLDGGRTPIEGIINNPFPNGITKPPGSSLGFTTNAGRGFNFVNTSFQVPYVNQYSLGFQYSLPWASKIELSYVGNRTKKLQTTRPFNEPDLAFRQKCNPLEGGSPAFCNELLPNPFRGLAPFLGTTYYTATSIRRWDLNRPYPQFTGITEVARNDGSIAYDSFQVTFEKRARGGLNIISTYTLSKQIEEWGFNDVQKSIKQRGLYFADRPHRFTVGSVYQMPFGPGKRFFNTSNGFLGRLIGGWETNLILQMQSGRPWDLSAELEWFNQDAIIRDIKWKGTDQVWAFRTYADRTNPAARSVCAARRNDNGTLSLTSYSANLDGCTLANVDMIRRNASGFVPRYTSFRDSSIRLHSPPTADLSFVKLTKFTERVGMQLRVEMFNFTNTYSYRVRQFTNNPDDRNFGSVFPRTAGDTEVAYPRHIQLAAKIIF